jgi:hypothetical protein
MATSRALLFVVFKVIGFFIFPADPPYQAEWMLDTVLNPVSSSGSFGAVN